MPSIVTFTFFGLVFVEITLFSSLIYTLKQSPLPVSELAIVVFLMVVIAGMLLLILWLTDRKPDLPEFPVPARKRHITGQLSPETDYLAGSYDEK
ncbi:hypothetical protein [Arsenicibacter rosenii]|nr:hypothetical protein [Arsenicibacter rosenii]